MQEKKCRKTLQFERKQNRTACIVRTHIVRKIYSNLKKRTDGYHDLRTVMHSIDVCDTVTVELSGANDGGIIVECTTPLPPVNTAFTAARLFREKTGCGGVRIQIKKRIPSEAGLGGASADAAAASSDFRAVTRCLRG